MSNRRGSGSCCSAIGCSMRRGTNLLSEVKMYKFPTDPVRRAAWCNALKRANWIPNKNSLICNAHFVTGGIFKQNYYQLFQTQCSLHILLDPCHHRDWKTDNISK